MDFHSQNFHLPDRGRTLSQLSKTLKENLPDLEEWLKGVPDKYEYQTFYVKKRSGKNRKIESPNDTLKDLQLRVYRKLLRGEAIPTSANGFVLNRSIVDNARPHVNSKLIIKIDLKDFFNNIHKSKVYRFWNSNGWNSDASRVLMKICCKDEGLPQGAPTSPALSNVVNRVLDGFLKDIAKKYGARYSRYADDLTFSFPQKINKLENKIKPLIAEVKSQLKSEGYQIQYEKGIKMLRPHQRQIITGIVVNEDVNLPREKRRLIRAMRHKNSLNLLSEIDKKRLVGYESLLSMVNKSKKARFRKAKPKKEEKTKIIVEEGGKVYFMSSKGDFVIGDKITAGDNIGGIQNVGKFQDVIQNLNKSDNKELADGLVNLTESIINSKHLSEKEKESHNEALTKIGEEITKEEPDKTILKYMWEGLSTALKSVPDVVKVVSTVAPLIVPYLK